MNRKLLPLINASLYQANGQYLFIGLAVGLMLSLLQTVFTGHWITPKNLLFYLAFSVAISISIANSLYLFEHCIKTRNINQWQRIAGYYLCNLAGMFVGIELAYWVLSSLLGAPFHFLTHYDDYKLTPIIVFIVSTLNLVYHTKRSALQMRLQEKELDVIRLKQLTTDAELKSLQARMNPHFLYNSLNAIAGLTMTNPEKAEEMTLQLSKLFRYSMGSQHSNSITVQEEIDILNTYLAIEKVRFGDRIRFDVTVDDNCQLVTIPRFLLQPLVENSLKHGLKDILQRGELLVSVTRTAYELVINVADNGIPFPDSLQLGYGLQSTFDKLNLLYGSNHQIQLVNPPDKCVRIVLPIIVPASATLLPY
ncbi:sensor histidine kinase [Spirosoma pomorum]